MNCPHCQRAIDELLEQLDKGRLLVRENVVIQIRDSSSDALLEELRTGNLVVDAGLDLIRDWSDGTQGGITQGAVGTDGTSPANAQTALVAEVYRTNISQRLKVAAEITHRIFVPKGSANGNTLREAGLFNANNKMFSRVVHDPIAKSVSNTVTIAWTHSFARA
ncbi:hypothetical protein [Candidatus Nitrospira bockiana]